MDKYVALSKLYIKSKSHFQGLLQRLKPADLPFRELVDRYSGIKSIGINKDAMLSALLHLHKENIIFKDLLLMLVYTNNESLADEVVQAIMSLDQRSINFPFAQLHITPEQKRFVKKTGYEVVYKHRSTLLSESDHKVAMACCEGEVRQYAWKQLFYNGEGPICAEFFILLENDPSFAVYFMRKLTKGMLDVNVLKAKTWKEHSRMSGTALRLLQEHFPDEYTTPEEEVQKVLTLIV